MRHTVLHCYSSFTFCHRGKERKRKENPKISFMSLLLNIKSGVRKRMTSNPSFTLLEYLCLGSVRFFIKKLILLFRDTLNKYDITKQFYFK